MSAAEDPSIDDLQRALRTAAGQPSALAMTPGLQARIRFICDVGAIDVNVAQGGVAVEPTDGAADITIRAAGKDWAQALQTPPPPGANSFAAWQLRNPAFDVAGDPLAIARARSFLEALVEGLGGAGSATSDIDPRGITGSYHRVHTGSGAQADIFIESAGRGSPLLCLHTAGADARQFHGVLAAAPQLPGWRVSAFDMPSHGRSMPAAAWQGESYRLSQDDYVAWCVAVIEQVIGEPVTIMGCSMGAAIGLVLAAQRPDLIRGVIALEAPVRPRGRRNPFLTHAGVNGGWHSSAYVRGLMSPTSPLDQRRRAAWIYAQGAPGVYDGDLMFYSDEFDGEAVARQIDGKRIPVRLMSGHYDFSATVADAHALAGWIDGARVVEMADLGHFPMIENPSTFLRYLVPVLDELATRGAPSRG